MLAFFAVATFACTGTATSHTSELVPRLGAARTILRLRLALTGRARIAASNGYASSPVLGRVLTIADTNNAESTRMGSGSLCEPYHLVAAHATGRLAPPIVAAIVRLLSFVPFRNVPVLNVSFTAWELVRRIALARIEFTLNGAGRPTAVRHTFVACVNH